MTRSTSAAKIVPMLAEESLYVGIDIGKFRHVAGFVSTTMLQRHERFESCPVLTFEQSLEGFRTLIARIEAYVTIEQCYVLMEKTGHYHKALEQYLLELDVPVYLVHVQTRPSSMIKTDKRDALTSTISLRRESRLPQAHSSSDVSFLQQKQLSSCVVSCVIDMN